MVWSRGRAGFVLVLVCAAVLIAASTASAQAPGGVDGAALWIKANQGVQVNGSNQVEQWFDQSGSGSTATQLRATTIAHTDPITPTDAILWVPGSINFNPSVDFMGAVNRSLKGNAASNWATGPLSIFAVTLIEGPSLGPGGFSGVWTSLANWTVEGAAGGVGLIEANGAHALDGNGCTAAASPAIFGRTQVVRGAYETGGNTLNGSTWLNGGQAAVGGNCAGVATTLFEVGGRTAGQAINDGRIFNGKIAEVVVFKSDLTEVDEAKIESYLALKYGVTLRATGGTPHDYVTSAGATIWSGVANPAYHHAIAGIAADSGAGLDQRVSQSVAPGDQIAIAAGAFDFAGAVTAQAPATLIGDQSALVWGDNDQSPAATVLVTDPATALAGVEVRMARVWRTQVTAAAGLPSTVSIRVPAALIESANPTLRNPVLLISTGQDFSTGNRAPIALTKTGDYYYATFPTFAPGEYFTLAGIVSYPDLTISKLPPASVVAGDLVTYIVTAANPSTVYAHDVSVSDTLPSGLTFDSSTPACPIAAQTVTCALGTLAPSQSVQIAITARVAPTLPAGTVLANTATVTTSSSDPDPVNNTVIVNAPPSTTNADLTITKAALEATATAGGSFTYRIVVANQGPSPAMNVRVTDPLPTPLSVVSGPGCTAAGQQVTCGPVATLAPGASATFELSVRLDAAYTGDGTDIANVATAASDTPDANPGNNSNPPAPPPALTPPQSDVQIVKHVSSETVTPGTNFTYTLQVTNNGPSLAANVRATDSLPVRTTFVSSTAGCTAPGAPGALVTCPAAPTLAVGATQTFDIVVRLDPAYTGDGSDIINSATVTSDTHDPQPQNNTSPRGAPPVGAASADLALVKTVSPGPVRPGQTFTYTLLVSNQGPSTAVDAATTDTLPAGITFVSSAEGCTASGQVVTCPTIPSFAPGAFMSYHLVVQLDPGYSGDGSDLPNVATVSSPTPDPAPGNNSNPPITPAVGEASADLSVTKTLLNPVVSPGMVFTYRIVVTNHGPSPARDVVTIDDLPAALTFMAGPAACTALGQQVTCTQAMLSSGTSATFDLSVRLAPAYTGDGSDLQNSATASSSTPDPNPGNNTTPPTAPPSMAPGAADVSIAKTGPADIPDTSGAMTYTIIVSNMGPNAATNIVVNDPVPAGLTFVSTAGDCATAFPCALGTLLPGHTRTITAVYTVSPDAPHVIANTATVSSATPDPMPRNNTATALTPPSPFTYYFAEGVTGTFWNSDILLANPTGAAAPVTMRFFPEGGGIVTHAVTVPPESHMAVRVDDVPGLESAPFSAQIVSDAGVPLAVERTMTWQGDFRYGGHAETAVAAPSTRWYFAEGSSGYFSTFVLLENPGDTPAQITVTFLREFQGPFARTLTVAPHARYTLETAIPELSGDNFGILVEADVPVVAERSMYFGSIPTRPWSGGHSSAGVPEPAQTWFYAEGATGDFFDTFFLLSNPQAVPARVTLEYILSDGTVIPVTKVVAPRGRLTVKIDEEEDPRLRAAEVSTRILADVPIITERSMYWRSKPDVFPWSEGHNSFGLSEMSPRWALASGAVGGPDRVHTYILLLNPWDRAAEVMVTYLRESGQPLVKRYTVPPTTRYTIAVNDDAPELQDESFGARIEVTNGLSIGVERSVYWDANGVFWTAGTNAVATKLP